MQAAEWLLPGGVRLWRGHSAGGASPRQKWSAGHSVHSFGIPPWQYWPFLHGVQMGAVVAL
eukprot:2886451-Rhodomonas_salina.1